MLRNSQKFGNIDGRKKLFLSHIDFSLSYVVRRLQFFLPFWRDLLPADQTVYRAAAIRLSAILTYSSSR